MNKMDVLVKVKTCLSEVGINDNEYIIVYGAAMVLHGLKQECNDIDITVTPEAWDRIVKEKNIETRNYTRKPGHLVFTCHEDVDFFRGAVGMVTDPVGEEVDGVTIQTLESLRNEKLERGRDKDLIDVKLIDEFISKGDI